MNDELTFPTEVIYPLMVEAHRKVAEVAARNQAEIARWFDDGQPTRISVQGHPVPAKGYNIMPGMMLSDINHELERLYKRIQYVGLTLSETISLTYEEFMDYTQAKYSLKGGNDEQV